MIQPFESNHPQLASGVYIAPNATVIGNTTLGADVSIWFGAVVRGDVGKIHIGARTNIQDLSVIHVSTGTHDTHVGAGVTVGHRVILHGCSIADHVLVGMGAIIMDGVEIGRHCLIGAGALLPPGKIIPEGSLVMGAPGRVVRGLTDAERLQISESAAHYVELGRIYARAAARV